MSRRKAREIAFKVLFQVDQVNADPRPAFDFLIKDEKLAEKYWDFSWDLVDGCLKHLGKIDKRLAAYSRDWAVDRMSSVDRNIMRIAGYEILFMNNTHAVIAIDEAIEISKKYGDESSASFVNAILDRVREEKHEHFSGD